MNFFPFQILSRFISSLILFFSIFVRSTENTLELVGRLFTDLSYYILMVKSLGGQGSATSSRDDGKTRKSSSSSWVRHNPHVPLPISLLTHTP